MTIAITPAATRVRVCSGNDDSCSQAIFTAHGSDALVYVLAKALPDSQLRYIAKTNTQVPTSVFVVDDGLNTHLSIRWFNPSHEIIRCGHGTLAAAAVLARRHAVKQVRFHSLANERWLTDINDQRISVSMQAYPLMAADKSLLSPLLAMGSVTHSWQTAAEDGYAVVVIEQNVDLRHVQVDLENIACIARRALIVLQKKATATLAFRYFAPQYGVIEDQATLSAASVIAPVARALSMPKELIVQQHSPQGALMYLSDMEQKIVVTASATIL